MPDDIKTAQTTEVEAEPVEVEEVAGDADGGENETEFSDSGAEDGQKAETETEEAKKPEEPTKPGRTDANAEAARRRREAERQAEIKKARTEAIIEALGGVNPFTGEKIEDDADVSEYLTMKEIEKAGKDPLTDYSRFLKAKTKEQEKAAQEQTTQEEWFVKDREDFATKHPGVDINAIAGDEVFRTFAEGKIGTVPMTKIYADYQALEKKTEERAKQRAAQILANKAASPGKLSGGDGVGETHYTREQVKAMTREEVSKNYDKIQTSMKKWN